MLWWGSIKNISPPGVSLDFNFFINSSGPNAYFQFDTSTLASNGLLGFVSDDFNFRKYLKLDNTLSLIFSQIH